MRITLGANAGVAVKTENAVFWIDLLHTYNEAHFSPLTKSSWERIKTHPDMTPPDGILFTHRHNDHFSPGLLNEAAALYPGCRVILPKADTQIDADRFEYTQGDGTTSYTLPENSSLVGARPSCFKIRGDLVYFMKTKHEGAQYEKTMHESIVIASEGRRLLITGDLIVDESAVRSVQTMLQKLVRENEGARAADEMQIDAVLCTFPWEATYHGRAILSKMAPESVILYHIPFAEDDVFGYRPAVMRALARGNGTYRLTALMEPFDYVDL